MNSCAQNATGFRSEDAGDPAFNDVITMRHPSGAQGVFSLRQLIHGSDNTPGSCGIIGTSSSNFGLAHSAFPMPTWPSRWYPRPCPGPASSPPPGRTHTHHTGHSPVAAPPTAFNNLGKPARRRAGRVCLRQRLHRQHRRPADRAPSPCRPGGTGTRYVKAAASGPYPARYGTQLAPRGNPLTTQIRPMQDTQLRRDGMLHRRYVDAFDGLARPVRIVESSTAGP